MVQIVSINTAAGTSSWGGGKKVRRFLGRLFDRVEATKRSVCVSRTTVEQHYFQLIKVSGR